MPEKRNHPHQLNPGVTVPTGWRMTDAVMLAKCPRCLAAPGFDCERPSGRPAWPPHGEREAAYANANPTAGRKP